MLVLVVIFRLIITTAEQLTVEQPSLEDARRHAAELEAEYNKHHRHGERTRVKVVTAEPSAALDEGKPA